MQHACQAVQLYLVPVLDQGSDDDGEAVDEGAAYDDVPDEIELLHKGGVPVKRGVQVQKELEHNDVNVNMTSLVQE